METPKAKEVIVFGALASVIGGAALTYLCLKEQWKSIKSSQYSDDMEEAQIQRIIDQTNSKSDFDTTLHTLRPEVADEIEAFDEIIRRAASSRQQG